MENQGCEYVYTSGEKYMMRCGEERAVGGSPYCKEHEAPSDGCRYQLKSGQYCGCRVKEGEFYCSGCKNKKGISSN